MDPEIWSQLPEHLLDRILAFIPLKTFLRLRSTCKRFNSLVYAPCFISKHSMSASPFSSFIFLSHPQFQEECPLFNTVLNSWCNTKLSLPPILSSTSSTLISSSNGLLCFSIRRSSVFVIYNLVGRSFRLVKFPSSPFEFELLTFISFSNGYKLFVMSTVGSSTYVLIYNSIVEAWQQFEGFSRTLNERCDQKGALYNRCLYFTTPEPFTIACFDLESGKWERPAIGLPNGLTFARLVSDEERKLYLIGGIGFSGICRSMKVWEMSEDGENWVEVDSMPDMVYRKFVSVCYHNYEHVYCFLHQGLICLCCFTWPEILYYKVSKRTWHWLPKCPSLPEKWSCGFRWFSFKPRLYGSVV